jgi:hypothetical protein
MLDYKIGDTVEVIDFSDAPAAKMGDICEVIDVNEPKLRVKRKSDGVVYMMFSHRFRLYKARVKNIEVYGIVKFLKQYERI